MPRKKGQGFISTGHMASQLAEKEGYVYLSIEGNDSARVYDALEYCGIHDWFFAEMYPSSNNSIYVKKSLRKKALKALFIGLV